MRVLITGGAGFIGSHLGNSLVGQGHEVLVIDNLSPQIHGDRPNVKLHKDIDFIRQDIRDITSNISLLEGVDVVYHLVSETGTGQSMYQINRYCDINCMGTAALLEAIAKLKRRPKHFVLASSRSVYGEGAYAHVSSANNDKVVLAKPRSKADFEKSLWEPTDFHGRNVKPIATPEEFPLQTLSLYAATKASQELLIKSVLPALGIQTTVLRLQNVYGEGQSLRNPYTGIISIFFNRIRQGLPISIYEDGLESRDFVHVSDVVRAMEAALRLDFNEALTLNIGSGKATTVSDLAKALIKLSGFAVAADVTGQYRLGDIRHGFADVRKAENVMGWSSLVTLEDGLSRFIEWALSEPEYSDLSSIAENELKERGMSG